MHPRPSDPMPHTPLGGTAEVSTVWPSLDADDHAEDDPAL